MTGRLRIAIPLVPQFTAPDAIGRYEVLQRVPAFDITFVGHARGEVRADNGMLGLVIDGTFEDLLDGLTAATHWASYPELAACGATRTPERVVEHLDRWIITAAGVSAGIDMALRHRTARRPDRSASSTAPDRVRPAAAVRLRRPAQGRG